MLKKLLLTLSASLLIAGCAPADAPEQAVSVVTTVASEASLPEQLLLTGTLEPDSLTQIAAKTSGRIATLSRETGERVQRGEMLARLDAAAQNAVSASLQKNLAEAEKQLATIRDLYDERIKNAAAKLASVQTSAQAQIALVETRLRTAGQDLGQVGESTLTSTAIVLEQAADTLDLLLGVSDKNRTANDDFERYLGALDSSAKTAAEAALRDFLQIESAFRAEFEREILQAEPTEAVVGTVLGSAESALGSAKTALAAAHTLLLRSTTAMNYTAADLAAHKNQILTLGASVEAQLASVQSLLGVAGQASSLAVLDSELAQTRAAVGAQIQAVELDLANLQKEKEVKLAEITAQITRFTGELAVSGTSVADTTVVAPASGIITQQFVEVGQVVAPGMPIFELADDSRLKIVVAVPDAVAPALFVGGTATVTLDSLPGQTFAAQISKITPTADPVTKKRSVELSLPRAEKLALGLFARVSFALPEIEGIVIPASALVSRYGQNFVFVAEEGRAVQRQVVLGTRTSQLVAIESGLAAGEVVITKGNSWLRAGDLLEIQNTELTE
jgi:multidrug efflux pump subunit AcrA (membrane-fusion protein)